MLVWPWADQLLSQVTFFFPRKNIYSITNFTTKYIMKSELVSISVIVSAVLTVVYISICFCSVTLVSND